MIPGLQHLQWKKLRVIESKPDSSKVIIYHIHISLSSWYRYKRKDDDDDNSSQYGYDTCLLMTSGVKSIVIGTVG